MNPFFVIQLKQEMFVRKVVVTKNKDCCTKPYSILTVAATDGTNTTKVCGSSLNYGVDEVMEFTCMPPILAKHVNISTSTERDVTLALCEIEVFSIGK